MAGPDNPYKLTPDDSAFHFEEILEAYARDKAKLQFPRLAIVGGQPGAGKSTVIARITQSFDPDKQPVVINMDDFRDFHPAAREIFSRNPFGYALYTNEDAWRWASRLLRHARKSKNNALYEATLRVVNPIETIIKSYQDEGYAVDLHTLAVNSKLSIRGIFRRYEAQLVTRPAARWTPIDFHDDAYRSLPFNVAILEQKAGFERVAVYRREGETLYLKTDAADPRLGAAQAIVGERNREWSHDEKQDLVDGWKEVLAAIEAREGNKPEWYVENAKRLAAEAELFAVSRPATADERTDCLMFEDITHHHEFARSQETGELVCFDRDQISNARTPVRDLRLVAQPE